MVAVFGATDREGSIGRVLLENLKDFQGTVIPVPARTDELLCVKTISALPPVEVDLAVLAVPVDAVESTDVVAVDSHLELEP